MDYQSGHVMTLANSIIGVSVLAMPYCFKQCGIVLSILMLLISSIISRLACHFLVKCAIIARRKTFENLAYYIFGAMGKFAIEIGIIGFLIGTCIAFFVVMGDLGPEIISEITGSYTTNSMRTSILMALALFCVLPLGLLRNIDSLNSVSKATIGFYCCLVLRIVFEGIPHIFSGDWYNRVNFWRPEGILQCLPIFTMALFCQTQLFEIYQALQNATLEKMNNLVRVAVNICTWVYIFVGVFGYIAFFQKPFTGNILLSFPPSLMTDVMKIGFVLSVAFSFPLVIFPCRASLYSLLYKEGYPLHEGMSTYIPESRFKGLTLFIVFISLIIGIMIPNIELVLGLVGSTIGVMICVLFPVTCFICISPKNTNERILAQLMLMIGVFVMVLGTYKNLYSLDNIQSNVVTVSNVKNLEQLEINVVKADKIYGEKLPTTVKTFNIEGKVNIEKVTTVKVIIQNNDLKEVRHEPPQPIEPVEEVQVNNAPIKNEEKFISMKPPEPNKIEIKEKPLDMPIVLPGPSNKSVNESKNDEVDIEAIKKEDKEVEQQEKEKIKEQEANKVLIDTLQKQNEVKMEYVEQQKKIIENKVLAVKKIESIVQKAIEEISGGKNDEKIMADVEKHIQENVKLGTGNRLEENIKQEHINRNVADSNDIVKEKLVDDKKQVKENVKFENTNNLEENGNGPLVGPDSLIINDSQKSDIVSHVSAGNDLNKIKVIPEIAENANDNHKIHMEAVAKTNDVINDSIKEEPNGIKKEVNINLKDKGNILSDNSPAEIVKRNTSSVIVNVSNTNLNNTAPLFLKLGKSDVKVDDSNIQKMMPLPLIMSVNSLKNFTNPSKPPKRNLDLKEEKSPQHDSKEELKVLRRDIL